MDTVESSLNNAQQSENSGSTSKNLIGSPLTDNENDISTEIMMNGTENHKQENKYINLIKFYDYQITEMQHEYELLLEDKVLVFFFILKLTCKI
jgi:hypothetical protein